MDTDLPSETPLTEEDIIKACLLKITPWASSGMCIPGMEYEDGDDKELDEEISDCIICGSVNKPYIYEGKSICPDCGANIGTILECNTMGRTTDRHNTNIERVGAPIDPHLPQSSMGTSIRWSRNSDMMRLRRFQQWGVMPSRERSLFQVYKLITTHCSKEPMAISKKEQDTAKNMYHIISEHYKTRGAKRLGLIAACIYYACKMEGCPRNPSSIAERFCIRNKDISCGIRTFQTVTSGIDHPIFKMNEMSTLSENFIGRYCTVLSISDPQVMRLGEAMCKKIKTTRVCEGYTPTTVALSVLAYIMECTRSSITHKAFCELTDVSPGTISRCKKTIYSKEDHILPPKILKAFKSIRKQSSKKTASA